MKTFIGLAAALIAPLALAHEGHGQPAAHWHATDVMGFVLLALIVAGALWSSRRK